MLKEIGKANKKLDEATRKLGQEANEVVGTDISHALKPSAHDHKEVLKDARKQLGIGDNNQEDNTELTGAASEEHHEN